jgi:heptosyltransferase-2
MRVIEGLPFFDHLIEHTSGGLFGPLLIGRRLRQSKFDTAILFTDSFRSALEVFLAGIARRIGYRTDLRSFLLTDRVDYEVEEGRRKPVPMVNYYLRLVQHIGAAADCLKPVLCVSEKSKRDAQEFLAQHGIREGDVLVGISPGAKFGSSKLWLPERFAEVADALAEKYGAKSIIFCGPGEEEICRRIAHSVKSSVIDTSASIIALDDLKAFIQRCDVLITTDSGPRHFAVALERPAVVLIGPTDPRYTNANLEKTIVLRVEDLECSPCHKKICPRNHECMMGISSEQVISAAEKLLSAHNLFR